MRSPFALARRCTALVLAASLGTPALHSADTPPAIASLTYSGDQAALEALDRDLVAAGQDAAKLAAIESSLFAALRRNDMTYAARQAICQRLGPLLARAGAKANSDAYKPLGAMLLEERDSDLARLALDPAPGATVDGMFTLALGKTSGRTLLGIINSVARRRIEGAIPALTLLLADKTPATSTAAARALGEIGTPAAEQALRTATQLPPVALAQARLQATARLPAPEALRVLRDLQDASNLPGHLRAAAFRRSLDLDSGTSARRIAETLGGTDWTFKQAALEALADNITPERGTLLTAGLAKWDAPTQSAVVAALARSGNAVAVPAVLAATRHANAEVRADALTALGFLPGSGEVVAVLARIAADDGADAKIARQSLARLNGPNVSAAILAGAERGEAKLRAACLEQLALRNMTEGLPLLLKCRHEADAAIRAAALSALADLAPASEQPAILDWTIAATDDAEQTKALRALANVTLRNPALEERGRAIYSALESAKPEVTVRLLPVLSRLGGSASADCAAHLALRDDAKVSSAAVATLGRWTDATALASLTVVAEKAALPATRTAAQESAVRYLDRNREIWIPANTTVVSRLVAATPGAAARKPLLALLARANDSAALKLAESLQTDSALAAEASYAAAAIKSNLAGGPKVRASSPSGVSNMLDGKTSSRWSTALAGEEWVEIDFRQSRPLRRITLDQTGRAAEYPEQFAVHVTDDPKTPGPAVVKGQGQRNKTVIEFPAGTQGRYVVIKNTVERKETPWAICELYVD